jgi:hypothetical protein
MPDYQRMLYALMATVKASVDFPYAGLTRHLPGPPG